MGLRKKTIIFISASFLFLFCVLFLLLVYLLTNSYSEMERKYTEQQVRQAINFFNENIANLKKTSYDYAAWDQPYDFMLGKNPDFIESQVSETFYSNIRVNLLLYVDNQGKLVYGRARDFDKGMDIDLDKNILADFQPGSRIQKMIQENLVVSGVLVRSGQPFIFAASPITKTNTEGPIAGTIILARMLSAKEVELLGKVSRLPLSISTVEKVGENFKDFDIDAMPSGNAEIYINPISNRQVAGYIFINDVYGNKSLVLRTLNDREIFKKGQEAITMVLMIVLVFFFMISVALVIFLKWTILDKIKILNDFVQEIATGKKFERLIEFKGSDEITSLASNINIMIISLNAYNEDRLQKDQELVKSEKELRATVEELEKFNKFATNRELKMVELKRRIKDLEEGLEKQNLSSPENIKRIEN
jgi:sensor domain CHASE-containing protein